VTTDYPVSGANIPGHFRGKPSFDFERWQDARPAAEVCPTEAISFRDDGDTRIVTVDYGRCIFCGLCAGEAARITQEFELATRSRNRLVRTVTYGLNPDGTHSRFSGGIFGESYTSLAGSTTSYLWTYTFLDARHGRKLCCMESWSPSGG
jgi:ferredoxin